MFKISNEQFDIVSLCFFLVAVFADVCSEYTDCTDCLNPRDPSLDCGWCSPYPAQWSNGSQATQCMDHTSQGWTCFHIYSHDGCLSGYVCNATSGTCQLGPAGTGDTFENCENSCSPIQPSYSCNATTFQCVEDWTGSSSNQEVCNSKCTNATPTDLIGFWRGLDVQLNFSAGEFFLDFSQTALTWGPLNGQSNTGYVASFGDGLIRISLPDEKVIYASYSSIGWPTGEEVRGTAIALQKGKQMPPNDITLAMGDPENFDVYVMVQCNPWKKDLCDFSSAALHHHQLLVQKETKKSSYLRSSSAREEELIIYVDDPCAIHDSCDSCINDPLQVCGWCDGIITYGDNSTCGEDGNGCCGGAQGFSECNVAYRRECPVLCDWINSSNPTCREATTQEISAGITTYADCDTISSWCLATMEFCNATELKCYTVQSANECDQTPGCDSSNIGCSNCTAPDESKYYFCDATKGCQGPLNRTQCQNTDGCDASSDDGSSCNPTVCLAQTYYTCDTSDYTCKEHTGSFPTNKTYYNTSAECSATCIQIDVSGIWRGLQINQNFTKDEWDFEFFTNSSVNYISRLDSTMYQGTYTIGELLTQPDDSNAAYAFYLTLNDSTLLSGLISDGTSQGPLTKFIYLGIPRTDGDSTASFDDAMRIENQEFVLIKCLPTLNYCDFSNAIP